MASGGFKPLGPSKIYMDTSMAMSLLGFPSSQAFEHTEMEEVQSAFMRKVQKFELACKPDNNPRTKSTKRDELRKVNEAYQYLIRKRRKLTGRAMNENWQLMGTKSNKAIDIISTLKLGTTPTVMTVASSDERKKAENEFKRQQERESAEAKALAAEIVRNAGLEMPVADIINNSSSNTSSKNEVTPKTGKSKRRKKRGGFTSDEKSYRSSASQRANNTYKSNFERSNSAGSKPSRTGSEKKKNKHSSSSSLGVSKNPNLVASMTNLNISTADKSQLDSNSIRKSASTINLHASDIDSP